jgi:hypothetical protein
VPEAGKFGRLPFDPERPRLVFEKYLDPRTPLSAAGLPPVSLYENVDRASKVSSWPMYCNDQVGCCTISALGHMYGAWATYSGRDEALFADSEITSVYSRNSGYVPGNPATDTGCNMASVLADQVANGMEDNAGELHKVLGYAAFGNPADEDLLGQALDVFGSVYVGFNVQQENMTEFGTGVWTWTPGAPFIGGHCVPLQRRLPAGSRHGILQYVTWGELQLADFGFQAHLVEEAWVVVTQDWVQANGVTVAGMNVVQLLADMQGVK